MSPITNKSMVFVSALCLLAFAAAPAHALLRGAADSQPARQLKRCGNAAGEAACITACASVAGMPICLSDACYGPNGPDFSPNCGKDSRRLSAPKRCGNAAGETACISACASIALLPVCLSDACYGPNGPDFSPNCGKDSRRLSARKLSALNVAVPHSSLAVAAPDSSDISSWRVSAKHGTQSGVGVSVSGAGAYAKLTGTMSFSIKHLDDSQTYQYLKKTYDISGGVSGFWDWIGFGANASTHKTEIHKTFNEVKNQQDVEGKAAFDLEVTGQYPNVEVTASAYVLILQIKDSQGNTYNMASSSGGASDTGAQDGNGVTLPSKDNASTITI